MIGRRRALADAAAGGELDEAKRLIRAGDRSGLERWVESRPTLQGGSLRAALEAGASTEAIDRSVKGFLTEERVRLERGFTVLATLGSNAPFIGLFGTVLGIIQAFGELAAQSRGTQAVMSGIAEALIATAVGLFVAIPAVVAYNAYSRRAKEILTECEVLRDLFVARFAGKN